MRSRTLTILFALTAILLFAFMIQQATGVFSFKELSGVTKEQAKPELSFDNLRGGRYQTETENYLQQHYGFREPLTRLHNQMQWTLFRYSQVEEDQRIMITSDNWIFEPWSVEEYYQSLAYHHGYDSAAMAAVFEAEAQRLLELQEFLEPYGTHLFVALLPGKEQICPEHLPKNDRYFEKKQISAYGFYAKRLEELGVNHIDLSAWFQQLKGHTDYPLFPQTGTHWSNLAAINSADTLVRYMEWLSDSNMVNIKPGRLFQRTLKPDADLESLMNLIWPLQKEPNYLAAAVHDYDTTAWRPRLITIGDSFYWNILNFTPVWDVFESVPYWYYFSTAYFDDDDLKVAHNTSDLDVLQEVIDADFVMLSYSTVSLYKMSNGFSEALLQEIKQKQNERQQTDN
ncbi:MAG: hypothetical protein IKQ79_00950 [Bacteroidales bacterium]|nr:hypothetical protein [Bacteroidales bacterium]